MTSCCPDCAGEPDPAEVPPARIPDDAREWITEINTAACLDLLGNE